VSPEDGLIITCPECQTRYRYDEQRFEGSPSKRVKCTGCGFTFKAANPAFEPTDPNDADVQSPAPRRTAAAPADGEMAPIPPLPTDARYSLAVIAGPQAGIVFQMTKPRLLLGRGSTMDIQLRDSEVSRRHAMIEIRDPDVTLTDLGATNGTWFKGVQIERVEVYHQDEFTLGSTTLMLIVTPVRAR
jgi:predicted Zn finger-like uncharacterized protein